MYVICDFKKKDIEYEGNKEEGKVTKLTRIARSTPKGFETIIPNWIIMSRIIFLKSGMERFPTKLNLLF